MIRAIFFDVANTLLHKPDLMKNIQASFSKHGYEVSVNHLQQEHQRLTEEVVFPDKTTEDFYMDFNLKLCEALGVDPLPSIASDIYDASRGLKWSAFDDTANLDELPLPLGIASNWDRSLREKLTHYFSIEFDWILVSEEMGVKKPQHEFFNKMVETSGFSPHEIMFVGDSMRLDIVPGNKLGIDTVLIDRNNFYADYEGKRISTLNQLTSLL